MYLKSLMKLIRTAYEKKGVAVIICPNDLLTQQIKDTTNKPVNTTKPKAIAPKFKNIKKAAKLINKSKNQLYFSVLVHNMQKMNYVNL